MSVTKTEIKIEKRLGELLTYLASDALQIEHERAVEGESDFSEADLNEMETILDRLGRMVDSDVISLLGSIEIAIPCERQECDRTYNNRDAAAACGHLKI